MIHTEATTSRGFVPAGVVRAATGHHCAYRPEQPVTWVVEIGTSAPGRRSLR